MNTLCGIVMILIGSLVISSCTQDPGTTKVDHSYIIAN